MKALHEMFDRMTSTSLYDRMLKSLAPIYDYLGINHFYYVQIFQSGHSSILDTNPTVPLFLFENLGAAHECPVFRHPDKIQQKVLLLKNIMRPDYQNFLSNTWDKFKVNFTIHIQYKHSESVESFGVGIKYNNSNSDDFIINQLPIIEKFFNYFRVENKKLIEFSIENKLDFESVLKSGFYEEQISYPSFGDKQPLYKQLGLEFYLSLTEREKNILKFLVNGYPASYIAKNLHLSTRTVENYIATIKSKLHCDSKTCLINKAKEFILL